MSNFIHDRAPNFQATIGSAITDPLPRWARFSLIAYILLYRVIFPPIAASMNNEWIAYLPARMAAEGLYEFMLVSPLIFIRRIGWLHPLIFPLLFQILKDVIGAPLHLIDPFHVSPKLFVGFPISVMRVMDGIDPFEYSKYKIYWSLVQSGYLAIYFTAFLVMFRHINPIRLAPSTAGRNIQTLALVIIGTTIIATIIFLELRGGFIQHILSFNKGRYTTLTGLGVILIPLRLGAVALAIWLAYRPNAVRNPIFWTAVAITIPTLWLTDGSRSLVIFNALVLIVTWILRTRRIPYRLVPPGMLLATALLGMLGLIRHDFGANRLNEQAFSLQNADDWLRAAGREVRNRQGLEGDLGAFIGADKGSLLMGRSYLSPIVFFVPRSIWPDKPKTAHAYNTWVNLAGRDLHETAPSTYGTPLGPVTEAFWNFGLLGVMGLAIIMAYVWSLIVKTVEANYHAPWMAPFYGYCLLLLHGGSNELRDITNYLVMIAGVVIIAKVISGRPQTAYYAHATHHRWP